MSKRLALGLMACLVLAAGAGGTYFWLHAHRAVPEIPLEGQDAEVAETITEAREEVLKAPRSANAWGRLGRVLVANEIFPEIALDCFLEAERLDPDEPRWPYFSAGLLAGDLGKADDSLRKFERAIALADNSADAPSAPRLFFAETLASLGKPEDAAHQFKKVLAKEPSNPRAHFGLGMLAYAHGEWQKCRSHLEVCLSSAEARKKAATQLAMVCERLKDKESADKYAKFAAHAPKDFDWYDPYVAENLNLAVRTRDRYRAVENLEAQNQLAKAADILRFMIANHPNDDRPHLMMGRILGQMGELSAAKYHLLKAREMAPGKVQVHYLLSLVLFRQGEALAGDGDAAKAKAAYDEAAQSARQALGIRPDYGYAHMALGLALKKLDRRPEALAEFRKAVECNPEYSDNHLFLGEALAEAGDVTSARYHLDQACLLANPNDPRPRAAAVKLRAKSGPKSKS